MLLGQFSICGAIGKWRMHAGMIWSEVSDLWDAAVGKGFGELLVIAGSWREQN